mgnify:FL=1
MTIEHVLIAGQWRAADASETFRAENPATKEQLPDEYPVSTWADCETALECAASAFAEMRVLPGERLAGYLETLVAILEQRKDEIVALADQERA